MSNKVKTEKSIIKERTIDVVKGVLMWAVITGLAFLYWMAVLLIFSLILVNVWHTSFDAMLRYSVVLTVITSAAYVGKKIYKLKH